MDPNMAQSAMHFLPSALFLSTPIPLQMSPNKCKQAPNKLTPMAAKPTQVTHISPRHNWPPATSTFTTSHSHDAQPTGHLQPSARTPKKEVKREEKREERVQRGKRRGQGPPPSKPNTPLSPLTPQRQWNTPRAPHPCQRCRCCANANGQAHPPAPAPAPAPP